MRGRIVAEQQTTAEVLDDLSQSNRIRPGDRRRRARRRLAVIGLAFMPVLAAVGWLGWSHHQLRGAVAALDERGLRLDDALAGRDAWRLELEERLRGEWREELARRREAPSGPEAGRLDALEAETGRLGRALEELRRRARTAPADGPDRRWRLHEADYLVTLAARRLELEADVATAMVLLGQADRSLLESGAGDALGARQALAVDLSALRAAELPDREGLYLRIGVLMDRAAAMDLAGFMRRNFENRAPPEPSAETGQAGWLDPALTLLGSVFVWRRWEDRPETVPSPEEENLVRQQLRLLLQQAQLAVLSGDGGLYRASLSGARERIERHAAADSPGDRAILEELARLGEVDLAPPLPSLERSLAAVRQLAAGAP